MRRILLWFSLLLATLVVSLAVWLWTADLGVLKPQIERWVSERTGREFAIDGDLSIDLGQRCIVIAEDIRFANAAWGTGPHMLAIGRAEIHLSLRSIFKGPLLVDLVDVDDASVRLATRENGPPNWDLGTEPREPRAMRDETAGPPLLLKKIDVERFSIKLEDAGRARPLNFEVLKLNQVHRDDDMLELSLDSTLNGNPVVIRGEVGGWGDLLAGADVRFDIEGKLDTVRFESDGRIDDVSRPRRPSLGFKASAPDINDLLGALGLEEKGDGTIDLAGSLRPEDDGPLTLQVHGNLGRMEIEATGSVSDLQNLERFDLDLLATAPDLSRLLGLFGIHQLREAPFTIDIEARRERSTLVVDRAKLIFAEAQLDLSANMPNFPGLDQSRIALDISGPDLERFRYLTGLPGQATGPFSLDFDVEVAPDGVELLHLDLETSLARVDANGKLGNAPDYIGSEVELTVRSDNLATLGEAYGVRRLPDRPVEVSGTARLTDNGFRTVGPLVGMVNDVRVALDGNVTMQTGLRGSELDFEVSGPDSAVLLSAFGVDERVPAEAYDFSGKLQIEDNGYRFDNVTGTLGSSNVNTSGLLMRGNGAGGTRISVSASGPAFEEIIAGVGDFEVMPGPYESSGSIVFEQDALRIQDFRLDRERGSLAADLELGMPIARQSMNFDIRARGPDIRAFYAGDDRLQITEAPFSAAISGQRRGASFSVGRLDIAMGDVSIEADGDLEFGDTGSRTQFRFAGNIPDLSTVASIDGRRLRPQSIQWNARVEGGAEELRVDGLDIKLGDSDIAATIRYVKGNVPQLNIGVESESVVLAPLLEVQQDEVPPTEPPRAETRDRLAPAYDLPFDAMASVNATVDVTIGQLERDDLRVRDLQLHADLKDGVFTLRESGFRGFEGFIQARATIDPADGNGRARVELIARDFAPNLTDLAMRGSIDVDLEASGNDVRTLLGSANGIVVADLRGGRTGNSRFVQMIYGDLLNEIIGTINPFSRSDPYTRFECIVIPAQVANGVVSSTPNSFIRTDKMNIAMKSNIDLNTERLEINLRTSPRQGLGISAAELLNPFIRITGTLSRPRLAVDEQGVLITGGAAVATGGLSLLARGLWDRLTRDSDPCEVTGTEGRKQLADRFPVMEPLFQ